MDIKAILLRTSLFFAYLPTATLALDNTQTDEPVEHIEVTGVNPVYYLKQMVARRNDFFNLYNQLVEDKGLRIKCSRKHPDGHMVREGYCEPVYVYQLQYQQMQKALLLGMNPIDPSFRDPFIVKGEQASLTSRQLKKRHADLVKEVERLVKEHPELNQKYHKMNDAVTAYNAVK
jgi:hypothetical protein